jgi:mono/diheme cytochrome c family protein
MRGYRYLLVILLAALLAGCANLLPFTGEAQQEEAYTRMGPGRHSGMQGRHHASIPFEYAGSSNANKADDESVERGGKLYTMHCASCHGDSGLGEGPAGANLDPPASPIAHTSQMLSDDYLFWRISEGGVGFETSMPAWKDTLDEGQIWDLVNYTRALGRANAPAVQEYQAEHQAEMLAQAVGQGLIDKDQADAFQEVHDALESYLVAHPELDGSMDEREGTALQVLVDEGAIDQEQALVFFEVHDLLSQAGLMP